MKEDKCIKVWRYEDAPQKYKNLSEHGGDEDWVAFVPNSIDIEWILWMDDGTNFAPCDYSDHKVEGGIIRIGAHA